jgi:hypothetical protein
VIGVAAVFWALAYAVGLLAVLLGLFGALTGAAVGPIGGFPFRPVGFGIVLLVAVPIVLVGVALGLLLPVALYLDAEAVGRADVGWEPDPVLYGLVGVVGLFAQGVPIQPAVACYYLYGRHRHVGTP